MLDRLCHHPKHRFRKLIECLSDGRSDRQVFFNLHRLQRARCSLLGQRLALALELIQPRAEWLGRGNGQCLLFHYVSYCCSTVSSFFSISSRCFWYSTRLRSFSCFI